MKHAKSHAIKTITESPFTHLVPKDNYWIAKQYWFQCKWPKGVLVRVVKCGNYFIVSQRAVGWKSCSMPVKLKKKCMLLAQFLDLPCCEWIFVKTTTWYLCGCYRWQGVFEVELKSFEPVLTEWFCLSGQVKSPTTLGKSDRPDINIWLK